MPAAIQTSYLSILWGLLCLLWLPFEDQGLFGPVSLGGLGALALLREWKRVANMNPILRGGLVGAMPFLLALGLMLVKSGLHSHAFPDFPLSDFVLLLKWMPVAAVLGAAISFALKWRLLAGAER